ncbi:MAG: lytic transglycosylase domain-containing protein [Bacteroidales bacterium]|nr:lytic transglycosylase domain-containing protein [Bacteroidales bacterium]
MKKIMPMTIAALCAACVAVVSLSNASPSVNSSAVYTSSINPDIPDEVEFCGQTISLDRADMWERYDRELTSIIYTHGNTLLTIKRANKFFPVMAPILKQQGVPEDVLYLACVESYLNPRAYSGAKAAGIWQFIADTAKQYGLEVNDEIDERYHLEKATAAACKYLKKAYAKYGNWESVMAAYNGGNGRITRELEAQIANTSFDLHLTDETSRYVFRIMAMKEVMENPRAYGYKIKTDQLYQPQEYETVEISGSISDWPTWAKNQGITFAQLREANPWIRAKKLTNKSGKTYQVKVPTAKSLSRSQQKKVTYNPNWVK